MKPVNQKIDYIKLKATLEAERNAALGSGESSDLSEQRMRAYNYYMGDMRADMPSGEGLSSATSSDVQDVVEGLMPILLDVLTTSENIVEFRPQSAGDEAAARQETDYVNYVFYQKNPGFLTVHNAVKDALLSKNCFVKWWMEPDEAREREKYEGLPQASLGILLADTDVEVIDMEQYEATDPNTNQPATYFNVVTERRFKKLQPKIAAVPPEEILISKSARNVQDAPYWAHIQKKPEADCIALFPDKEQEIKDAPTAVQTVDNGEALNRQTVQDGDDALQQSADANKAMRLVELAEHYIRLPLEEDGVARRYKITTVGTKYAVLDIEEVPAWPMASGTAIIMSHRFFGRAAADLAIDIQQIKTSLLRSTLNNAYFANNQRTEVSETHASENTIDDLLNNRVGGIVRTKMPGGLNPIPTQPVGQWITPVIEYMDGVRETRTGLSKNTTGLDIDSMNHARTGAVSRIMDAAEMRVKLMARVLAETLIVDMMRGIHGMLQQYSEESEEAELSPGSWVTVNPREWKTRRDMRVNLPLGGIGKQQMLGFLSNVLGVQKELIQQQAGTNGPMVTLPNVYYTVDQMLKTAGLKSAEGYFQKPPPPDPNAPKPPDPKMVEAQAKAQATQQQAQAGIAADQEKTKSDLALEQMKLDAQQKRDQAEFAHKLVLDRLKFQHDTEMERLKTQSKIQVERDKADAQIEINRQQAKEQAKPGVGEV